MKLKCKDCTTFRKRSREFVDAVALLLVPIAPNVCVAEKKYLP